MLLQVSARRVTKRQQGAILRRPMRAKDLPATAMRALRVALAITWAVYRLRRLPRNDNGHLFQEREIFLRRSRRASARHCFYTMARRHGSDGKRFFGQDLDEQLRCREHNPRHEQGRACKQQKIVEDSGHHTSPMRTAPCTADVPGPAADMMGIPPTLRLTPDGSIGSPFNAFFWCSSFLFSWRGHKCWHRVQP